MKTLPFLLATSLLLAPGCIIVHVRGDLDGEILGDGDNASDFRELAQALEGCLVDPEYGLEISASPWHAQAQWRVRYAGTGVEGHAAFAKAKEAVLRRIEREGAVVTEQANEGPHAWSCSFELHDEEGEASVRLVENAHEDSDRPHLLEIAWEEAN